MIKPRMSGCLKELHLPAFAVGFAGHAARGGRQGTHAGRRRGGPQPLPAPSPPCRPGAADREDGPDTSAR